MNNFMTNDERDDMERRRKLLEELLEGMENPRAMMLLLNGMQDHINKRVPRGSTRSEQQDFLYAMLRKWKIELKYNKI